MSEKELSDDEMAFIEVYLTNGRKAGKAYQTVKETENEDSANSAGSRMLKKVKDTLYFVKKNQEILNNYGFSFKKQLDDLEEIKLRCVEKIPVMTWERDEKGKPVKIQETNGKDEGVWTFDSRGALGAIAEQNKMLGFHKPTVTKLEGTGENGKIELSLGEDFKYFLEAIKK
jgi:hypothetical protein